ncbi:hypothetical protein TRICI_004219 [Trichomonascus ciferrii]|uniref:Uncharacterized protein n=1 Tax=Trichomonascus ciferrii TaxID=44093 RepID=A0A642V165_9ASCO|nr:hypothetical protein TRICI_004219 [Trichomonascus ciferrii]
MEELMAEEKNAEIREFLVKKKAQELQVGESALESEGVGNYRTYAVDTLSVWLQRAAQCCSQRPEFIEDVDRIVRDEDMNAIFDFVCDFWTDSGAAFGNALKELFVKTISLMCKIRNELSRVLTLQKWTDKILKFPKTMRVLYFTVEILAKHVGGDYILKTDPDFVDSSFKHIGTNALANQLGKALFSIFRSIQKTMDQDEWVQLWAKPTYRALSSRKTWAIHHIQTYFLMLMFKTFPSCFDRFIIPLYQATDKNDEHSLSVLVGCLKVGQDLSIDVSGTVGSDFLVLLLKHISGTLRVGGLSLLVSSPQMTRPVGSHVYGILKKNMDNLLVDADSGYRNKIFGLLRQFTFRIRGYSYACVREQKKAEKAGKLEEAMENQLKVEEMKNYCQWYLGYLQSQLRPGTPYHGLFAGTKLLELLVRSGLDEKVDRAYHEKQHIPFPFSIKIFTPAIVRLLTDNMTNNYEDIRTMSASILRMAPKPLEKLSTNDEIDKLAEKAKDMVSGMRGREGDGGSRVIAFVFQLYDTKKGVEFADDILKTLENEIAFANKDLAIAVREHCIHGYFTSLRMIFEQIQFEDYSISLSFIQRAVNAIDGVWKLVKNILCHDSPEGNLPEELESNYEPELEDKYGPATQVILSYSWRAVKEAAALLQTLVDRLPEELLPDDLVLKGGDIILTQLATVRHRGAFSSVYPTFISCCKRCNSRPSLQTQSEKWLTENLKLVQTKAQFITRRSGGLPYLITAIITAETKNRADLLKRTFDSLVEIAGWPAIYSGKEKMDLPQVHAFNCIKNLFIESDLSSDSAPHLDRALQLAISSFSNEIWAIRNCAVMLFTALQNRLFGAKFDKKVSARLFFTKYRRIKPVLLSHLEKHVKYLDSQDEGFGHHVETVYPVLSLLARLEGVSGFHGLDDFKPLILDCLKSRIWKIREMAARTLTAFATPDNIFDFSAELITPATIEKQNELHGRCLALQNIATNFNIKKVPSHLVENLESKFTELLLNNPSPETCLAYYRVMKSYASRSHLFLSFSSKLPPKCQVVKASSRMFREEVSKTLLEQSFANSTDEELVTICNDLLSDHAYEVQQVTISTIDEKVESGERTKFRRDISQSLWNLFETSDWDQVRGPCVRLFSKLCGQDTLGEQKERYWNVLYESIGPRSTEEINEAAIESLGFLAAKMDSIPKVVSNWIGLIRRFSDENEEFPTRLSALKSLRAFLESASSQICPGILLELFFFLSDDDYDLREMAAEFTSSYLQTGPCTSTQAEIDLIRHIMTLPGSLDLIVNLYKGNGSPSEQINATMNIDEVLFTVEKQNLFRNHLAQLSLYKDLVGDNTTILYPWANNAVSELHSLIKDNDVDGILGWTSSNPDLFFVIQRIIHIAQSTKLDTAPIRVLQNKYDIHESLRL